MTYLFFIILFLNIPNKLFTTIIPTISHNIIRKINWSTRSHVKIRVILSDSCDVRILNALN